MATIETIREERLVEHASGLGSVLGAELAELAERHPSVGDVRGLGLFWGLELVRDRGSREPLVPFGASGEAAAPVARVARAAMDRGLFLFAHWNVLMVAPPLTIDRDELGEGIAILDQALRVADAEAARR